MTTRPAAPAARLDTHLPQLLRAAGERPAQMAGLALLGALATFAEGAGLALLVPFAGLVLQGAAFTPPADPLLGGAFALADAVAGAGSAWALAGLIFALIAAKAALAYAAAAWSQHLKARIAHDLRVRLARHLLTMDYAAIAARPQGETLSIVTGETWRASDALDSVFRLLARGTAAAVFAALLLALSWPLALFTAALALLSTLALRLFATRARALGKEGVAANAALTETLSSLLQALPTVRFFAREDDAAEAAERRSEDVRRTFLRMELVSTGAQPALEVLHVPLFLGVVGVAAATGLGAASLFAFLLVLLRLAPQLRDLENERLRLAGLAGGIAAVLDLLADSPAAPEPAKPSCPPLRDAVTFDRVRFSYPGRGEPAVDGVSFRIRRGSIVALVGASGAGKSTLLHLLLRLFAPQEGAVLYDGAPAAAFERVSYLRRFAYAGQNAALFPGTIAGNIAFARPNAARTEIESAARAAHAAEFIDRLPHGFDTPVGADGAGLSGGQRQRLSLARALLADPDVLVLDEATNALDALSEARVRATLSVLRAQGRTCLVVAHRLGTIRDADWAVALAGGRVAEQGPPAELLARNAAFAALYRLDEAERSSAG